MAPNMSIASAFTGGLLMLQIALGMLVLVFAVLDDNAGGGGSGGRSITREAGKGGE
jgi:hypothetical protein